MSRAAVADAVTTLLVRGARAAARVGERAHLRLTGFDSEPLRLPLSILGALFVVAAFTVPAMHGWDLVTFGAVNPAAPYALVPDGLSGAGAFRYAPPLVLALAPLSVLPWDVLVLGWLGLQLAALWYIGGRWALVLVLFPPVWLDLVFGNINLFLAAMIAAGFRHPGVWAFALLTKVTPGIGVMWFAVRREWRALAWVVGATAGLSLVSILVLGSGVWGEWFGLLRAASAMPTAPGALPIPILPRVLCAVLLTAWGGLTDRRWVVPVAVTLAMPVLWPVAFAPLAALGRVNSDRLVERLEAVDVEVVELGRARSSDDEDPFAALGITRNR